MTPLEAKIEELKPKYYTEDPEGPSSSFDFEGFGKEIAKFTYETVKPNKLPASLTKNASDYVFLQGNHVTLEQLEANATQAGITEE